MNRLLIPYTHTVVEMQMICYAAGVCELHMIQTSVRFANCAIRLLSYVPCTSSYTVRFPPLNYIFPGAAGHGGGSRLV